MKIISYPLLLFLVASSLHAGTLFPAYMEHSAAISEKSHAVEVVVDHQVAITKVMQTFVNHYSRDVEALYRFTLPEDGRIQSLTMWNDGKKMVSAVAREMRDFATGSGGIETIGDEWLSRSLDEWLAYRDLALLEHVFGNTFQIRVSPVRKGKQQRIELIYWQVLSNEVGTIAYRYPMKRESQAKPVKFSFNADIASTNEIADIACDSHPLSFARIGSTRAKASFADDEYGFGRDLQLCYTLKKKPLKIEIICHRDGDEDGYFMALIPTKSVQFDLRDTDAQLVFAKNSDDNPIITGRYRTPGTLIATLTALNGSQRYQLRQSVQLPEHQPRYEILKKIWASQQIDEMLHRIRRDGENFALVDRIFEIATKHNIATPYTPLALANEKQLGDDRIVSYTSARTLTTIACPPRALAIEKQMAFLRDVSQFAQIRQIFSNNADSIDVQTIAGAIDEAIQAQGAIASSFREILQEIGDFAFYQERESLSELRKDCAKYQETVVKCEQHMQQIARRIKQKDKKNRELRRIANKREIALRYYHMLKQNYGKYRKLVGNLDKLAEIFTIFREMHNHFAKDLQEAKVILENKPQATTVVTEALWLQRLAANLDIVSQAATSIAGLLETLYKKPFAASELDGVLPKLRQQQQALQDCPK